MKAYEIAYLISPGISQEDAVMVAGALTSIIEKAGGNVQYVDEPKKRRLAYDIQKERQAYLGYTQFAIDPLRIAGIRKQLPEEPRIIRYAIVEALKVNARLQERPYARVFKEKSAYRPRPADAPHQPATIEEIDKKLEEILK